MTFRPFCAGLCLIALSAAPVTAAEPKITPDVVYGHKDGMALILDVIAPEQPNGAAVLYIPTGGWYSVWSEPKNLVPFATPFLDKGLTVFIVRHGSAPKYTVPECVADVRRCVRFIRMKAGDFGLDPQRLGVVGGSAGGHLTLMLATTGDDGDPTAGDEVLRHSSRIACGVSLYPPTDLHKWTTDPPAEIRKHAGLKPPLSFDPALEDSVSPILHVTPDDAPVLLIHGDLDLLVPIEHSTSIMPVFEQAGVPSRLIVIEGAAHGFSPEQNQKTVAPAIMEWFEQHLVQTASP